MGLILFVLGLLVEIALSTAYVLAVGLTAALAIAIVAPLCIAAEVGLFLVDVVRPPCPRPP